MALPSLMFGTFKINEKRKLYKLISTCITNNITAFDTAPSYNTESKLGSVISILIKNKEIQRESLFLSSKIDIWQMYESKGNIEKHFNRMLKKMKIDYIDQLLIHWPFQEYLIETWSNFRNLYNDGLIRNIGICNVNESYINQLAQVIKPMVVQNERHPLRNDSATLSYCKLHGIEYQAYSPIGQMMDGIKQSAILNDIASKYNKDIGQVILKWHIQNDVLPVFSTSKESRIINYSAFNDFKLSDEECNAIDSMDANHKIFLESEGCPGF